MTLEQPLNLNDAEKKAKTKELLSFDEFISKRSNGMKIYNNFPALFIKEGMFAEALRGQEFFKKFIEENKELEELLSNSITELSALHETYEIPEEILEKLYEAYKIMLSYDNVPSNDFLFT